MQTHLVESSDQNPQLFVLQPADQWGGHLGWRLVPSQILDLCIVVQLGDALHIMVGLGTMFFLVMGTAAFLLWRGRLMETRPMLWVLMLAVPFPYIATTAGWWTAELGRQPWLVYGMQRTVAGGSPQVSAGDVVFTTLGFAGLYLLLGLLFIYQVIRLLVRGPE